MRHEVIWEPAASTVGVDYGRSEIERLLQHRDPFLLLDRITLIDPERGALEGRRRIDPADPVLGGHFPGEPVYPGALQIEIVAQLSLCCYHFYAERSSELTPQTRPRRYRAVKVHHAAFLGGVFPGDELTVRAQVLEADTLAFTCAGQLLRAGKICATAVLEAYLVDG
jgi:3-hydroxyacyl-[acyl-carrier-protein] dehydratase